VRDQLTAAIEQRKFVTFTYQGHPRRVQPAAYGVGNRKGKETLHAYQVDGGSARGGIPHWRNFWVERIEDLTVLDEVFGPNPPGFTPSPFPTTYAALTGGASAPAGAPGGTPKEQVLPGIPVTPEQAAKAVEQAGEAIGKAADALGKWFRKKR
jgi:hypothetical protein